MGIVHNEQRNLKILRNDLEKRQKILEKEVLAHSRKRSELKAKERDVLNAIESFDAFTYQKKHLENRLGFLISVFEDLSSSNTIS
jgi:septal ring factor EnvC (AmiA/AmiB activator)